MTERRARESIPTLIASRGWSMTPFVKLGERLVIEPIGAQVA